MRVASIDSIGVQPLHDITVEDNHEYVMANGVRTHNTGLMYSSNDVWIIGKSQDKDGKELEGFTFTINIEKSRRVKEKSKIPISVRFDGGLHPVSGMFDIAKDLGYITSPSSGWYVREMRDKDTGEVIEDQRWRKKDVELKLSFFTELLENSDLAEAIRREFQLESGKLISGESEVEEQSVSTISDIVDGGFDSPTAHALANRE